LFHPSAVVLAFYAFGDQFNAHAKRDYT